MKPFLVDDQDCYFQIFKSRIKLLKIPTRNLLFVRHASILVNFGDDDPGVDGVDPDPFVGHLQSRCSGQLIHRSLAHVVGNNPGKGSQP